MAKDQNIEFTVWANLTNDEKKQKLFFEQKKTLDLFRERNAISQRQYDKSLHDLIEKMGIDPVSISDYVVQN